MANTFRKVYKKTGNSGSSSDYQLVGNIGVNGVELDIMKGAASSSAGDCIVFLFHKLHHCRILLDQYCKTT